MEIDHLQAFGSISKAKVFVKYNQTPGVVCLGNSGGWCVEHEKAHSLLQYNRP